MTLVVAGERSGVGKTTVTLALLASLSRRGLQTQSFKVGPDYIDPMFHQRVTGKTCYNLDPVLTSEPYVQQCFARHVRGSQYALIEGVMGLFDGATGSKDWASTAHMARLLRLPILLVLDCSRLSRSVAAIAHGYQSFDPQVNVAGIVLNRVGSDRHLELLTGALEPLGLPVLGVLRREDGITIPDRHLGLVPTDELPNLGPLLDQLAHVGDTCFDWSRLQPLLSIQASTHFKPIPPSPPKEEALNIRIALARDRAFNFYYADNLELLQHLGADLVPWSPLHDAALPRETQGLYFGGGFPEQFAQALAENKSARNAVCTAIRAGMPTYAECGGLMYLCEQLTDFTGKTFPMVSTLPTSAEMAPQLTLGYRQAIALRDSPLLPAGTSLWGHEFHRSHLTTTPKDPLFRTQGFDTHPTAGTFEGWQVHQLHASYVHLHWGDRPEIPQRFLQHCAAWQHS